MIEAYWEIIVRDRNGKVISKHRQPCRSLLANFLRILRGVLLAKGGFTGAASGVKTTCSVKKYDGSEGTAWIEWYDTEELYAGGTPMGANAGDNDDSYGIMVGSGTKAVEIDDYNLESKIPHGTGSGQLDYDTHAITISEEAGQVKITITRPFKNNSGEPITVSEVGLGVRSYWKGKNGIKNDIKFLIARDKLSTTHTVPDGGSLTVKITITIPTG